MRRIYFFRAPVPVEALLDRTRANDAVIEVVLARDDHPMVAQARERWEQSGFAKGRLQGLEQGITQGREQELRRAIEDLCTVLNIKLNEARAVELRGATNERLEGLRTALLKNKRWG